ncbi:ricin-type beta-trefoil lectin domain protein [Streptomyces sp. NPDC096046]|uniref:ricin-type beta-trefoil lectin domain protein n=1 Tax=Streptomyces sp. NPDC096046 TaxID=3155542 RepID=UPI00331FAE94
MATAAAFHAELARPGGGALRPRLLAAVRETAGQWAADDGISHVLPELRKTVGARGLRAARSRTPERRRLAERAFHGLPGASQCLLWHTEVEAEPISIPAGLLGVDAATASAALEQAREQFRTGCVRAHRELAPTRECRYYNRLLDVPMRRGGDLLPDVQRHLMACRYCRHAAEQLSHFEDGLEDLLVETVLGWGARRYLESRPGRDTNRGVMPIGGRHRHRLRARAQPAEGRSGPARRHTKALAAAVGVTSLVLLATLLAARGWTEESGTGDPQATWGAVSGHTVGPDGGGTSSVGPDATDSSSGSSTGGSSSAGSSTAATAGSPAEVARGRLRNLDAALCLDVGGGRVRADARVMLDACSTDGSQRWSYRDDGVLRSATDPTLCLGSDPAEGSVVLADCLVHAGIVRYDLTVRGELLPRGGKRLAVAPGEGRDVIVAGRDGTQAQRWALEPVSTAEEPGESREKHAEDAPRENRGEGRQPDDAPSRPGPGDTSEERPQERYETRFAQVDRCAEADGARGTCEADRATEIGEAGEAAGTDEADGDRGIGEADGAAGTGEADGAAGTGEAGRADGSGRAGAPPGSGVLGSATATLTDTVTTLHSAALP